MASGALGSILGGFGGGVIGGAVVQMALDDANYQKGLAQTQAANTQAASRTANLWKAGFAVAGVAAVAFAATAIKAASDQEEAANKAAVVFKGSVGAVEGFAAAAANSAGISKAAALSAAGSFGLMFTAAGETTDAAADMSVQMVQLAGDLSSFNNIGTDVALEKIRAGLSGEAEPLRQVGVFLTEAAVQQEAYTSGLAKAGAELTEGQKIQARYNIILEQTAQQQGDFTRTSDSMANQLRTVQANATNLAASFGKVLLPAVNALLGVLLTMLDSLPQLTAAVAAFGAAWVALNFSQTITALTNIIAMLRLLPQLMASGAVAAGLLGAGIAAGLLTAGAAMSRKTLEIEEFIGTLQDQGFATANIVAQVADSYDANAEAVRIAITENIPYAEALGRVTEAARRAKEAEEARFASYRRGGQILVNFANLSDKALDEFRAASKASFRSVVFDLTSLKTHVGVTRQTFIRASNAMEQRAKELSRAMQTISKLKWVPDEYVKFLSDQGPEWLTGFTKLNKDQQRTAVENWETSLGSSKKYNEGLNRVTGALKKLDQGETKHTVLISYKIDPNGEQPSKIPGLT